MLTLKEQNIVKRAIVQSCNRAIVRIGTGHESWSCNAIFNSAYDRSDGTAVRDKYSIFYAQYGTLWGDLRNIGGDMVELRKRRLLMLELFLHTKGEL